MRVIFDLDGTLANAEHRVHHLTGEVKDWRAFYADCADDEPVREIVAVLKAMSHAGHDCSIWTGRSDEVAKETMSWLRSHGIRSVDVRMRPADDHRPDTELKAEWLAAERVRPDLVFEDRASVVAMWAVARHHLRSSCSGRFLMDANGQPRSSVVPGQGER